MYYLYFVYLGNETECYIKLGLVGLYWAGSGLINTPWFIYKRYDLPVVKLNTRVFVVVSPDKLYLGPGLESICPSFN